MFKRRPPRAWPCLGEKGKVDRPLHSSPAVAGAMLIAKGRRHSIRAPKIRSVHLTVSGSGSPEGMQMSRMERPMAWVNQ
jgi:hypothetical protein